MTEELILYIKNKISDNLEFHQETVINNTGEVKQIIMIYEPHNNSWWYEQIMSKLTDIRKYCVENFGIDIIVLDLDIGGILDLWQSNNEIINLNNNIKQRLLDFIKKHKLNVEYILLNNNTICLLENKKPSKQIHYKVITRLIAYLRKNNLSICNFNYVNT